MTTPADPRSTTGSAPAVFITGAAAGIGRATALTFARRGYVVGGYDIDVAGLASLAAEIEAGGGRAITGRLDVTSAADFTAAVEAFVAQTGRLDVLVNNAGILRAGAFVDIAVEQQQAEIEINCKGVLHGAHAGFEHLRATAAAHGTATLINLASASAIYGQAELANYSATKFYVRGLSEALDLEWAEHGVRVAAIWPLFVQTAMLDGVRTATTDSLGIRLGPQDVADAVVAAAHPSASARRLRQVHFPVGRQTSTLLLGSRFSPAWLTRLVNQRLAH